MSLSPIDDLAALLKLDRAALEAAVPDIAGLLSDERLAALLPLIAAGAQREGAFTDTDPALRAQILRYHATETMTDRERAVFLGLPEGCRIRERAKILAPEKLVLGKNVWIGEGAVLDAQGGLTIGDSSQIGLGVMVWSHSSHLQAIRGETTIGRDSIVYKETRIGKNCFIAGPSVIAAGVTIGDGAIISPLTFIDSDVAEGERVSGPRSLKKLEKRLDALEKRLAARED
jgi:carbonic anhydrase/acetyltransferase-like protein (isoleucine patch superfamily)